MKILVLGGTGATGRLLVRELLDRDHHVTAIVRSPEKMQAIFHDHGNLSLVAGNVLSMDAGIVAGHIAGHQAVCFCLGHTFSFRGIFGPPWMLVRNSLRRVCESIRTNAPERPVRIVLMNTAGNRNRAISERVGVGERIVVGLLRLLVPPHRDNEVAAEYLSNRIGSEDEFIQWAVVRPDTLLNEGAVSEYEVHASPTSSAIFKPGQTSRINVAHFMADLATRDEPWQRWRGQMPVIYNRS